MGVFKQNNKRLVVFGVVKQKKVLVTLFNNLKGKVWLDFAKKECLKTR